ncbi:MAG: pirin family protein [Microscillaceae bacterium]|nr:pirin family protein [Microscillaceae bacterium]
METSTAKIKIYPANQRGKADHGWLKANFSFSFAHYYDPEKIQFGALRVLNDDLIAGGMGFGTHPHDNMEIVTVPLKGALAHKDSMGNASSIHAGDVQIMSAGTGVTHSEFNPNPNDEANTLQIWVFPKELNIKPRYDQRTFYAEDRKNKFQVLVSPDPADAALWINQDAYFTRIDLDEQVVKEYTLHKTGNGVYVFVIQGNVQIEGKELGKRDAIGLWNTDKVQIQALSSAELLLIEVPMTSR